MRFERITTTRRNIFIHTYIHELLMSLICGRTPTNTHTLTHLVYSLPHRDRVQGGNFYLLIWFGSNTRTIHIIYLCGHWFHKRKRSCYLCDTVRTCMYTLLHCCCCSFFAFLFGSFFVLCCFISFVVLFAPFTSFFLLLCSQFISIGET